jgi:hypothetical protein
MGHENCGLLKLIRMFYNLQERCPAEQRIYRLLNSSWLDNSLTQKLGRYTENRNSNETL